MLDCYEDDEIKRNEKAGWVIVGHGGTPPGAPEHLPVNAQPEDALFGADVKQAIARRAGKG